MPNAGLFVSSFRDDVTFLTDINKACLSKASAPAEPRDLGDEAICERLRAGDQGALRQLMDRHAPTVLRLAINVLSDRGEAEDVVQEVFITVWKCRESWTSGSAKFSTWLHRVAINKAIDKRRGRRSRPESMEFITAVCDALSAQTTACDQAAHIDQVEIARKLGAEIDRLPATQGLALRYFYFESRDVPCISSLMGCSEQAVRSLLKRGRQALRTRLVTRKKTSAHDAFTIRANDPHVRAGRR